MNDKTQRMETLKLTYNVLIQRLLPFQSCRSSALCFFSVALGLQRGSPPCQWYLGARDYEGDSAFALSSWTIL